MSKVKVFVKTNVDGYDSLHSCRIGGTVVWNGVNELLRKSHPGVLVRIAHETSTRFAAVLAADGLIPEAVTGRDHLLGSYSLKSQFGTALYESGADVVVLSILADVAAGLHQHREQGFFFHAPDAGAWPAEDRAWLRREFASIDYQSATSVMDTVYEIIQRLRKTSDAKILIYNLSPIIPGEWIHNFEGLTDLFSTRVREFNLALIDLSARTGVSIVDVDSVVARAGADRVKQDVYHLTPEGHRLVAREVVRILEDLGVLPEGERA